MYHSSLKHKARELRAEGKAYFEIAEELGLRIPKSTLCGWCKDVVMPDGYAPGLRKAELERLVKARAMSREFYADRRLAREEAARIRNAAIVPLASTSEGAKLLLAALYWAEGSKNRRGDLVLGNSDPAMIALFISLLKRCYPIEGGKFRGRLQCRADQDIAELERYWVGISGIPYAQLYPTFVDSRSRGRRTKKLDYKGVFVVNYFSADVSHDLITVMGMLRGIGSGALSSFG